MSRPRDLQIFWIVLIAGAFWAFIWEHDQVTKVWRTVSTAAIAMTSGLRAKPPEAAPAEDPHPGKSRRTPTAPKDNETEPASKR
ncbi:MAG: hypothetical protein JWO19_3047 [Bryobacterales bacterium]|nr:hypothetical protein [Bryobacterales bacterium]